LQETTMNKRSLIAFAAFFIAFAAQGAEPGVAAAKPAPGASAAAGAAPAKAAVPVRTSAPETATAVHSQQDRMRECNKQATGKKGAERKAFMKTCLSKKV
jgi:hypothetical protein